MKKISKGFTLIELLAVIVVLAIIALIAVPVILGVINKAKLGAARQSATGYVEALEGSIVLDIVKNKSSYDNTNCTLSDTDKKVVNCANSKTLNLKVEGSSLDLLYAVLNSKGYVTDATWKQGNFCGTYNFTTGAKAYECDKFTIAASEVEFIPSNVTDETSQEWKDVTNVQQALDYLYNAIK